MNTRMPHDQQPGRQQTGNGQLPAVAAIADLGARVQDPGATRLAEQAEEMALQLECVKLTDEELPLGLAYKRFLDLAHRAIPFEHGTLYVTEWDSGRLIPVAIRGDRIDLADQVRFARGAGLSAWVAQERRPVVIPDPAHEAERPPFADGALRAFLAFPLLQNGVVAGVVALARTDRTFSGGEFARLGRLAEPLAATLSKLRREVRLRELIHMDAETGLSNHHHFVARVEEELQRTRQHTTEFSVALLELDGIAEANRQLGRPAGVRLVQAFIQRLQSSMRTCDVAASLDDGRFGLLLAGVDREKAAAIVERIAGAVLEDNLNLPRHRVTLRLRFGLASVARAEDAADDLIRRAAAGLEYVA